MKKKNIFLTIMAFACMAMTASAGEYYASTFGIKSNGTTMNTRSIQKAIDKISEEGGGKLIFKVGRYLTGSIHLKDNVTIELGEGAILVGSLNPYDYDKVNGMYGLVLADGARNIAITGLGVIEGQGRELANNFLAQIAVGNIKDELKLGRPDNRPHLIYTFQCQNFTIKGINLRSSAFWTCTNERCDHLVIDGVTVESRAFWNNDGIDIVDCTNSSVQNCFVSSADDGICLKSHSRDHLCENIDIRNNVVTSSASAFKFGTFSRGGFKNIRIIGNTVYDTFRSAVAIEAVDGGMAENIVVDSLKSLNTANPVFVIVGDRHFSGSYAKNITISNLYAEVPVNKPDYGYDYEGPALEDEPRNISPCSIIGLPGNNVSDIKLSNIEIRFPGAGDPSYAKVGTNELDLVPEMPDAYPEFSQFKELPAWGFYIRHADHIVFDNVKLTAAARDYRPAVVLDDVADGSFKGLKAVAPALKTRLFVRSNCRNIKK